MNRLLPPALRGGGSARSYVLAVLVCSCGQAIVILVWATVLSHAITVVSSGGGAWSQVRGDVALLAVAAIGRGLLGMMAEGFGHEGAAAAISELRQLALRRLVDGGPQLLDGQSSATIVITLTDGLAGLDGYFARYLPQLALAVIVPLLTVAYVVTLDWVSAVIMLVTLPLIPVFAALIGWMAAAQTRRRWQVMQRLAAHYLDVLQGLTTLRIFGRGPAQVDRIHELSQAYRRATMGTLRIAFLSSFALELLASLSTAVIALSIGIRLVGGGMTLQAGLTVLVLAPEVYLPLRQLGVHFHASADGLEAAQRIAEITSVPIRTPGTRTAPDPRLSTVRFESVRYTYPARVSPALTDFDLTVPAGAVVALVGESGAGKSTVLSLLLAFRHPDQGRVRVGDDDLSDLCPTSWRARIAWVPQRPVLVVGTLADNMRLARRDASDDEITAALCAVGGTLLAELPHGLNTPVGERGATLSGGQRQRVALARALLRDSPLLLLDEPAAHLAPVDREQLLCALRDYARGRTVVIATHDRDAIAWADVAVPVTAEHAASEPETLRS